MPDLESRFIPIGSVPLTALATVLKQHGAAKRNGFITWFVLPTQWTGNQLAQIHQFSSQFPSAAYMPPDDYVPLATVTIDIHSEVVRLRVRDEVSVGYKHGKTHRSLGVYRNLVFYERDQSDEQSAALTGLAGILRTAFEEAQAEAKYSALLAVV